VLFSKGIGEESSMRMSWLSRARRNDIRFMSCARNGKSMTSSVIWSV
jgi:hypothetical protein